MGNVLTMRRIVPETDNVGELIDDLASRACARMFWPYVEATMPHQEVLLVLAAAFASGYSWKPERVGPFMMWTFRRERRP